MVSATLERKKHEVDQLTEDHKCLADDIINRLKKISTTGQKRISLFIEEVRDGSDNSGGV